MRNNCLKSLDSQFCPSYLSILTTISYSSSNSWICSPLYEDFSIFCSIYGVKQAKNWQIDNTVRVDQPIVKEIRILKETTETADIF